MFTCCITAAAAASTAVFDALSYSLSKESEQQSQSEREQMGGRLLIAAVVQLKLQHVCMYLANRRRNSVP